MQLIAITLVAFAALVGIVAAGQLPSESAIIAEQLGDGGSASPGLVPISQDHVSVPLLTIVIAFVGGLLGVGGWILSLERRKVDRSEVEAVRQAIRDEFAAFRAEGVERRRELLEEIRETRQLVRTMCGYSRE